MFKRYQRNEQPLILTMIELAIKNVSTRKIKNITEKLCGKTFSKSMVSKLCENLNPSIAAFRPRPLEKHYPFVSDDAMYLKLREDGKVLSKGLLIATAANEQGHRELIGFHLNDSESETI